MASLEAGRVLKHYAILEPLGSGGMGEVYRALDQRLERTVALKVLSDALRADDHARRRLLQEARSAAALTHPSIVTIHAIDEHGGLDFIVMEYIDGETLKTCLQRGPLPLAQLIDLGTQVADALATAHAAGIVHRDIKSSNILVTPSGLAKVLDFGLARLAAHDSAPGADDTTETDLTRGQVIGTLPYMSPEQTRGETLDARTDVFSLGCVLYEAATGSLPFRGPTVAALTHSIGVAFPTPPSRLRPDLPQMLDVVLERALAKPREQRYSAAELADALRRVRAATMPGAPAPVHAPEPVEGTGMAFVGREAELQRLADVLEGAVRGAGEVVFITGEPGIGKTAVVEEFLRQARRRHRDLAFARGRCVEQYGTGEAYLPFLDAISGLLTSYGGERTVSLLRTYAPAWCLQFPAVFIASGIWENLQQETMGASRDRMLREISDALGAMATDPPLVLVLEDLHWADPSSIDLLRHLAQRIRDKRLLIVGTYRPAEIEHGDHPLRRCKLELESHNLCEEVPLGALGPPHVTSWLNARFAPNEFPPELPALVHARTEGHPLFAFNLLQYMVESGDLAQVNGTWRLTRAVSAMDLDVPENVRSMIRKKLDALGERDRRSLQYASVQGEEFLSTVVAHLLEIEDVELEERLAALERVHRVVVTLAEDELPDGTLATKYRFGHALYQNVLYADLVAKRRVLLHRKAGEALERHHGRHAQRIAGQLAMHFERGREFGRAIEYLSKAGDNAARLYASAEAAEYYSRALELLARVPGDPAGRLPILQRRGGVHVALGQFDKAVEDFTEMLHLARDAGLPEKESAAINALTITLFYSHRLDEITARADEILQAAERSGSELRRIEALQVLALKQLGAGELDEAGPSLDDIIEGARRLGHKKVLLTGLAWRAILHFFQTEYERADAMLDEAHALARELRDGFLLLHNHFVRGLVRGNQGRMSEALAVLREGMDLSRRYGDRFWGPRMPNCVGWIYRELEDVERALASDHEGLDIGREHHVLEAQANSLINLGIDFDRAGHVERTDAAFEEVSRIFQADAWFRWRYNIRLQSARAEHHLALGRLEQGEACARELHAIAERYGARKYVAVAERLLARAAVERGDLRTAEDCLVSALGRLETHPVPILAWRLLADLARVRQRHGAPADARAAWQQSAALVQVVAGHVSDEALRSGFLASAAVREVLANVSTVV